MCQTMYIQLLGVIKGQNERDLYFQFSSRVRLLKIYSLLQTNLSYS